MNTTDHVADITDPVRDTRNSDEPEETSILSLCHEYLGNGGFFNPEMMDHNKVRDLIMGARDEITTQQEHLQKKAEIILDLTRERDGLEVHMDALAAGLALALADADSVQPRGGLKSARNALAAYLSHRYVGFADAMRQRQVISPP